MDIWSSYLVTGSQDHGIRLYDLKKEKFLKELYTKRYGHTEWVTGVSFLPDQRIVSVGMDNQICIWDNTGVRCDSIKAHEGSISKLKVDRHGIIMTSGYDHKVMVWDSNAKSSLLVIHNHTQPITELEWQNSLLVTGDRSGNLGFSDVNTG